MGDKKASALDRAYPYLYAGDMPDFKKILEHLIADLRKFQKWTPVQPDEKSEPWPPRFIATVPDEKVFLEFLARANHLQALLDQHEESLRWMPTFFDEHWVSATLGVNEAFSSEVLPVGEKITVDFPFWAQEEAKDYDLRVKQSFDVLQGSLAGFKGSIYPELEKESLARSVVFECETPITMRRRSGQAFRLHALTLDRKTAHKNIKVGVVVCRDVQEVYLAIPKRKKKNTKKVLLRLGKQELCF